MFGKLWAIARVGIAQAIRMKVAIVIVLFLIVLIPSLPFLVQSDGTQSGHARIALTYSMYVATFLLCVLTLFLSTASIGKEIEQKQIFVLDPKPVARWQIFFGKWLGIMAINACLLLLLGTMTYIFTLWISYPPTKEDLEKMGPTAAQAAVADHWQLRTRFLVARGVKKPDVPYNIEDEIEKAYQQWVKEGKIKATRSERWVKDKLRPIVARQFNSVPPLTPRSWVFSGLPPGRPGASRLQFRFKHFVTSRPENGEVNEMWVFGERQGPVYPVERSFPCDGYQEFDVPGELVTPAGTLLVTYVSPDSKAPTVIFPFEDGLQVFYRTGTLMGNMIRSMIVILTVLGFLAIVGLACGSCLSFPVAALVVIVVFFVGLGHDFLSNIIQGAFVFGSDIRVPGAAMSWADTALQGLLQGILFVFPPITEYNPVSQLSDALDVSLSAMVFPSLLWLLVVRGGIIAVIGLVIFSRRELGSAVNQ
jgi:hypothetical protein